MKFQEKYISKFNAESSIEPGADGMSPLEKLRLIASYGDEIVRLTDQSISSTSGVIIGSVLEGLLDSHIELGKPLSFDGGKTKTTNLVAVARKGAGLLIKTENAVYDFLIIR